ncbi:MAG: nucleoside-diphosphate sugar epimerase/dehydratase [Lachnospiraceae bacterium]|nr:nucleoside-diphosphate sugar epimerase/dehydratase [Lachnospiraceae bacterium]
MEKTKNIFNFQLFYRRTALICYDVASVCMSSAFAVLLRYSDGLDAIPEHFLSTVWNMLPIDIVITIAVFMMFKLYSSLWAFAGINELQNIAAGCFCSAAISGVIMKIMNMPIPRSYYFLYAILLIFFTFISRFSYRFFRNLKHKQQNRKNSTQVMIIGAGEAGNAIIKEIITSNYSTMVIRCIIDDDPNKQGHYIQGIKVVGGRNKIIEAVDLYEINEIIVAMPAAPRVAIREILQICKETTCKLRSLPGIYQLVNGEVNVSKLRDVEVEDLLGRESIHVDLDSILGYVSGKVVLITGGGGSIGSELSRQIATHKPKQLIIVDIYENNAYDIQQELLTKHPELNLVVLIASVRNTRRMYAIFDTYHPDIVYHAAAHKHVPLMESSPNEAIKNNVFGTWKTAQAAAESGVKKFVMISTDKAVNPTNIMGASKRICEMIVQTFNKHYETEFVAVRFGNVLGSNGSVIPLFKKQIAEGGPITVTHPDIIRYFMTIPEAVSLVLQAGAYAKGGEIFILDMGEPVKILDLAKNLIRLSGYKVGEDIKIEFTGLRPGEKLFEELLMGEEGLQDTANRMIHVGKPIHVDEMDFFRQLHELKELSESECAEEDIRSKIKEIVPTYNHREQ